MSESIPSVLHLNDNDYTDIKGIADAFAEYFGSVYEVDNVDLVGQSARCVGVGEVVSLATVQYDDVCDAIKDLKVNKSIGPDKIPSYVVKGLADFFAYSLKIIFNLSVRLCTFPDTWKEAKICPIYKKGNKSEIINYRPIAILNVPAKVFENVIYKKIYASISSRISIYQHGFMKARSTVSNLCNMSQFIL